MKRRQLLKGILATPVAAGVVNAKPEVGYDVDIIPSHVFKDAEEGWAIPFDPFILEKNKIKEVTGWADSRLEQEIMALANARDKYGLLYCTDPVQRLMVRFNLC